MLKEHYRRIIDHVSDYLHALIEKVKLNLMEEHVYGRMHVSGSTVIDSPNVYFDTVRDV